MVVTSPTNVPQYVLETAWGARVDPIADALWLSGYRCYVADGSLIVRRPDGVRYIICPRTQTCSCPATKRCKHLAGLVSLVFLSMSELAHRDKFDSYDTLCNFWFSYCCDLGRTR